MKEATGEANMTIVTVVLIGIVAAAAALILPNLIGKMQSNIDCQAQGQCVGSDGKTCEPCKSNQ